MLMKTTNDMRKCVVVAASSHIVHTWQIVVVDADARSKHFLWTVVVRRLTHSERRMAQLGPENI